MFLDIVDHCCTGLDGADVLGIELLASKDVEWLDGGESERITCTDARDNPISEADYDSAVEYPTLIYDGPFSDARETGAAKALPDKAVTQAEALQIARDFVGGERVDSASPGPEMGGVIPCWGVNLRLRDLSLLAAVTKQGGKILFLTPDSADFSPDKSVEECRENALQFLSSRGYDHMKPTYFQVYQGVAVVSFAATQGESFPVSSTLTIFGMGI